MRDLPTDIGALRRIDAESIRSALALGGAGRVYDLGMELSEAIPQGPPGAFVPFSMTWRATPEGTGELSAFQNAVETITGTLHVSSHIDALVHVQADDRIYGGGLAREARDDRGFKQHGMETVPPIVGRCVILDVAGAKGMAALPDRYEVTVEDLEEALARAAVRLKTGDVVLVRTGKIREFHTDAAAFQAGQPGVGPHAAVWLYEQGMAVLGTDTTGTEPLPFPDAAHTTHRAMLVDRGVHLVENVFLDEIAAAGVAEALFVCLPLKIKGATGSWVRPVAIA